METQPPPLPSVEQIPPVPPDAVQQVRRPVPMGATLPQPKARKFPTGIVILFGSLLAVVVVLSICAPLPRSTQPPKQATAEEEKNNRETKELIRKTRASDSQEQTHPIPISGHAGGSDVVVARYASPCGSSVEAFDEMVKWAVKHDEREMFRVLILTGSSMWTTGSQAKILDSGGFMYSRTKIRILETQRECWVPSEAVR